MKNSIFLFLSYIFTVVYSQRCCGIPQACPAEASCLCQDNVDSCIYQIVEETTLFNIRNQTNYFNWVPNTDQYLSITISFCSNNHQGDGNYLTGLQIQKANGKGYPQNPNITFTLNGNCYQTLISEPMFCMALSGGFCNLIMSLTPTDTVFPKNVQIFVQYVEGIDEYITIILIVIGCVLLLVIVILVAWMLKRRMEGVETEVYQNPGDLSHFKTYIPKVKLKQLIDSGVITNETHSCSVCLTDITRQDKVRRTFCCHIFHAGCIDLWCIKNLTCPMCRDLLDEKTLKRKRNESELMPIMIRKLSNVKIQFNGESTGYNLNFPQRF